MKPLCISMEVKDDLGHCIGKEYRSMVAILQPGFAKSVMKQLDNRPTTE